MEGDHAEENQVLTYPSSRGLCLSAIAAFRRFPYKANLGLGTRRRVWMTAMRRNGTELTCWHRATRELSISGGLIG